MREEKTAATLQDEELADIMKEMMGVKKIIAEEELELAPKYAKKAALKAKKAAEVEAAKVEAELVKKKNAEVSTWAAAHED